MKIKVFSIDWDTDGENVVLPSEVTIVVDDDFDEDHAEDFVSDYLSDEFGFCHNGFNFSIVK